MVDKIRKTLNKLSEKERTVVRSIMLNIERGLVTGYDIKKLKGRDGVYRIRFGQIRIIYIVDHNGVNRLIAVERRNDNTYR